MKKNVTSTTEIVLKTESKPIPYTKSFPELKLPSKKVKLSNVFVRAEEPSRSRMFLAHIGLVATLVSLLHSIGLVATLVGLLYWFGCYIGLVATLVWLLH